MPAQVSRINDSNSAGGTIASVTQSTVFANNKLISTDGSSVNPDSACDNNIHCAPNTANGSSNVFAENKPVNSEDDADTCGHVRGTGSPNVFVN